MEAGPSPRQLAFEDVAIHGNRETPPTPGIASLSRAGYITQGGGFLNQELPGL